DGLQYPSSAAYCLIRPTRHGATATFELHCAPVTAISPWVRQLPTCRAVGRAFTWREGCPDRGRLARPVAGEVGEEFAAGPRAERAAALVGGRIVLGLVLCDIVLADRAAGGVRIDAVHCGGIEAEDLRLQRRGQRGIAVLVPERHRDLEGAERL